MQNSSEQGDVNFSGVLERGLAILERLTGSAEGETLSVLSDELRIPRSATHRLLTTLVNQGFVYQQEDRGTYVLSAKMQMLAFKHMAASGVIDAVQPILNRLALEVGELVRLSVDHAGELTWVARAQGAKGGLRYDPDMGMSARLSCSASGYAWLSCFDNQQALAMVEKQGFGTAADFGHSAPQTVEQLIAEVEWVRQRGYAVAVQTFCDWMSAIAMPLLHPVSKVPLGVVSIAGPSFRLPELRLHDFAALLSNAIKEIQVVLPASPRLMSPELAVRNRAESNEEGNS